MKEFNWCFIGAGKLAGKVAEEILPSGRHRIATVYTRRWEACREFSEKTRARPCATVTEALEDPAIDGVYIVTPHNSHAQYAALALNAGKPVLVEKPFTVEAAQADALIALAREKGLYLAEAMWTFFSPVGQQALQWVREGALGRVKRARLTYHREAIRYAPRVSDPLRAGGALLDVGVYPLTYLYRLFGMPSQILCRGTLAGGIDLGEEIALTFADGLRAQCSVSIVDRRGGELLRLDGEKGGLRCRDYHAARAVTLLRKPLGRRTFHGPCDYLNEFDLASAEIREGLTQSRYAPLAATADVMRILDECRAQMGLFYQAAPEAPAEPEGARQRKP